MDLRSTCTLAPLASLDISSWFLVSWSWFLDYIVVSIGHMKPESFVFLIDVESVLFWICLFFIISFLILASSSFVLGYDLSYLVGGSSFLKAMWCFMGEVLFMERRLLFIFCFTKSCKFGIASWINSSAFCYFFLAIASLLASSSSSLSWCSWFEMRFFRASLREKSPWAGLEVSASYSIVLCFSFTSIFLILGVLLYFGISIDYLEFPREMRACLLSGDLIASGFLPLGFFSKPMTRSSSFSFLGFSSLTGSISLS